MAKYKTRPFVIEATQWKGPGHNVKGVRKINEDYYVTTIHGDDILLLPGDWVITEPDGKHYYPCKPQIFTQKYESA